MNALCVTTNLTPEQLAAWIQAGAGVAQAIGALLSIWVVWRIARSDAAARDLAARKESAARDLTVASTVRLVNAGFLAEIEILQNQHPNALVMLTVDAVEKIAAPLRFMLDSGAPWDTVQHVVFTMQAADEFQRLIRQISGRGINENANILSEIERYRGTFKTLWEYSNRAAAQAQSQV